MKLNEIQQQIIHTVNGPVRVLAGPGSGKTATMVERIVTMITQYHIPPEKILVITFTKAAAKEMQERFIKRIGNPYCPVHFHTFHSFFFHILKSSHIYSNVEVLSLKDKQLVLRRVKTRIQERFPDFEIESTQSFLDTIGFILNGGECSDFKYAKEVLSLYRQETDAIGKIDFDDFASRAREVFQKYPSILKKCQETYPYILIDEFQDVNIEQYEAMKAIAQKNRNIFVVADDDQSIYHFRGSNPELLRRFVIDFAGCKEFVLNVNYRSSKEIVEFAKKCIEGNENRLPKDLQSNMGSKREVEIIPCKTKETEEQQVLRVIQSHLQEGMQQKEIAIITRTNRELERWNVVFKKAGYETFIREKRKNLMDEKVAKEMIALLKMVEGIYETSVMSQVNVTFSLNIPRILLLPQKITKESFLLSLKRYPDVEMKVQPFMKKIDSMRRMDTFAMHSFIRYGLGYEEILFKRERREECDDRAKFDAFMELFLTFSCAKEFLSFVSDYEEITKVEKVEVGNRNGLNLITMHASKGLEFEACLLPDVNEGVIPYGKDETKEHFEEERRVFYVGLTRAKTDLKLFYIGSEEDYKNRPSRFIYPMIAGCDGVHSYEKMYVRKH